MTEILASQLEAFGYCDPASGKQAQVGKRLARQAIVIGLRDWLGRWFIVYSWAGRTTPTKLRDKIIAACSTWSPKRFGIEANGMQVLFGELVIAEAKEVLENSKIVPVYQSTKVTKDYRIRQGLEPVLNSGRLFLPDKTGELALEIKGFPTAATKDLVDALESMIRLAPKVKTEVKRDIEIERYASYLRSTRCPAHLIQERLKAFTLNRLNKKEIEDATG